MKSNSKHGLHKNAVIVGEGKVNDKEQGFRFTRIFPTLSPFVIKMSAAQQVGAAMTSSEVKRGDSNIPAGYTYFGQFIDHDITRDVTEDVLGKGENDDPVTDAIEQTLDADLVQMRSPSLDLDSVYGIPTARGGASPRPDGVRFSFAATQAAAGGGNSGKSLTYDLHRGVSELEGRKNNTRVMIPDNRNDENLAVGQMHAAWMRFHNRIATELEKAEPTASPSELFSRARALTTRHYQWIVLHDFLARVCDKGVHKEIVIDVKSDHFTATPAEIPAMPLEFSVAAFRFGHTMVRQEYEWNINFSTGGFFGDAPANFEFPTGELQDLSLFAFTSTSGMLHKDNPLPTNWITDWRRMLDFSDTNLNTNGVTPQMTKAIDPYIAPGMGKLPGEMNNLAVANLRRSGLRGLPCGQDVSRAMPKVKMLSASEMTSGLDPELARLSKHFEFDAKAPLWYYILQEGAVRADGNHLGEMGSRILCETFTALVNASRPSIIQENWTPGESPITLANGDPIDTLSRMFAFIDEVEPIVNPLEDPRL